MTFISDEFLLHGKTAASLYAKYAAGNPIFDYHCHLDPKDIAFDRKFSNLTELCLDGDHYKWRAMRANGIAEDLITGEAEPYTKFEAWARTVPYTLRNPLYHWTHLELKRYFGIDELLNEHTARRIWENSRSVLQSGELSAQKILRKFNVKVVCTTDDPIDSLQFHIAIAGKPFGTHVYPTFRPDRVLRTDDVSEFNNYVNQLSAAADKEIASLQDLLEALDRRHEFFHSLGCRLSDHGLETCFADFPTESKAAAIFEVLRNGKAIAAEASEQFASHLMVFFAELDGKRGWTKQLHLGALRNVNVAMLKKLGRDTGFDSIGDWSQAVKLGAYLSRINELECLPKIVLYNLNPADNYVLATMVGNFQDGSLPGRIQFGSGWWFLDQKDGIESQLNTLSNTGLLYRFVGMLTDSRSFMSFPRHEYFRRVLCNLLGREMETGELPNDETLIGKLISNICFSNARQFFSLPLGS